MPLSGVRVIELAGLAPAPFCGLVLSDFGAKVIRIDRTKGMLLPDQLARGKRSIALDLKHKDGIKVVKNLVKSSDVLIEPFRRGVMERLGLGPSELLSDNPRLIYARMTGYGQKGVMADRAGHDINYLATSGVLSALGRSGCKPHSPVNLLGDFAGGGLICALGIVMALFERLKSGKGQVIDANMVEGSAYVASSLWATQNLPLFADLPRGGQLLDGGAHFYDTYTTSDDKYIAVGAIEPQFYAALLKGLDLTSNDLPYLDDWKVANKKLTEIFRTKTRDEWTKIFEHTDACVTPVLELNEAPSHPHNQENLSYLRTSDGTNYAPAPAPHLSRTPGVNSCLPLPEKGEHTLEVLKEAGYSDIDINQFLDAGAVESVNPPAKL